MQHRIRNVSLVRTDDLGYRRFCAKLAQANRRIGPPQDPGPECHLSHVLERAARAMLAEQVELIAERVVRHEQQSGPYGYAELYRELDAVSGSALRPACLFEIKCTHARNRASRGHRQLGQALEPLGLLNPELRTSVIWVDTRFDLVEARLPEAAHTEDEAPATLAQLVEAVRSDAALPLPELVRLGAEEVWAWALKTDPAADPAMWAGCREIARERALRLRQRRELEQSGIPRERWPDEVRPAPVSAPVPGRVREDARASEFRHSALASALKARVACA